MWKLKKILLCRYLTFETILNFWYCHRCFLNVDYMTFAYKLVLRNLAVVIVQKISLTCFQIISFFLFLISGIHMLIINADPFSTPLLIHHAISYI